MFWHPVDAELGDIEIVRVGEEYHLFSEMIPLSARDAPAGRRVVGHAISTDLIHWHELPPALSCGLPGSFDAWSIYHMHIMVHAGRWFMFYTGLDRRHEPGQRQAIGLATSDDGLTWTKHPSNPVLQADPRWYEQAIPSEATYQAKDGGRMWFRDPYVVRDDATGGWGMIVIARDNAQTPDLRGCIAWASSDDLEHWRPGPPIFSPRRFHTIETPSIAVHAGRHYLIFQAHTSWGPPVLTTDPYQSSGNFYAVSETGPMGPYRQPEDEVLLAAHGPIRSGSAKIIAGLRGEPLMTGWLRLAPGIEDDSHVAERGLVLPPPKSVRFTNEGEIHLGYYAPIESYCREAPLSFADIQPLDSASWSLRDTLVGKCYRTLATALWPEEYSDLIFSLAIRLNHGDAAGVIVRAAGDAASGLLVLVNRRFGRVELRRAGSDRLLDARSWPTADRVELTVAVHGPIVEVYVNDRLMIQQVRYHEKLGKVGIVVERAEAVFEAPRLLLIQDRGVKADCTDYTR